MCQLGVAGLLQVPVGVVEAVVDLQLRDALAASIHRDQATLETDMHQPHQLAALAALLELCSLVAQPVLHDDKAATSWCRIHSP